MGQKYHHKSNLYNDLWQKSQSTEYAHYARQLCRHGDVVLNADGNHI